MSATLTVPASRLSASARKALAAAMTTGTLLTDDAEMVAFETDGFTLARGRPAAVALCESTEEVAAVIKVCVAHDLGVVPRGSGTGLTGGCIEGGGRPGVVVCTSRMTTIRRIDLENRVACVEAGVRNTELSDAVSRVPGGEMLHFAPDPSSQRASTVAGNAATNAGGLHTLKDFVTSSHV
ncbi:MAG: FAD-binding oxidoreductase, partial [Planctomycetota bacterium]